MLGDFGDAGRHPDLPRHKEAVMSELFGQVVGWLVAQGLTKGVEYETANQQILQCSKKVIWIDQLSPTHQIVWCFNSIQMSVEYGVCRKSDKSVTHREKLEGLRYNISTGTEVTLTGGSRVKFNVMFEHFTERFRGLHGGNGL